jgi:hypothetical protein
MDRFNERRSSAKLILTTVIVNPLEEIEAVYARFDIGYRLLVGVVAQGEWLRVIPKTYFQ